MRHFSSNQYEAHHLLCLPYLYDHSFRFEGRHDELSDLLCWMEFSGRINLLWSLTEGLLAIFMIKYRGIWNSLPPRVHQILPNRFQRPCACHTRTRRTIQGNSYQQTSSVIRIGMPCSPRQNRGWSQDFSSRSWAQTATQQNKNEIAFSRSEHSKRFKERKEISMFGSRSRPKWWQLVPTTSPRRKRILRFFPPP